MSVIAWFKVFLTMLIIRHAICEHCNRQGQCTSGTNDMPGDVTPNRTAVMIQYVAVAGKRAPSLDVASAGNVAISQGALVQLGNQVAQPPTVVNGDRFIGTYVCLQGATGLRLHIDDWPKARFEFFPNQNSPGDVCTGEFHLTGSVNGGTVSFAPGAFITNPCGYVVVGLSGSIINDGQSYNGKVTGADACTNFNLKKECCLRCNSYECQSPYIPKPGVDNKVRLPATSQETCCDRSCNGYKCPAGFAPKPNAITIRGNDDATCCDEVACTSFDCGENYVPKAGAQIVGNDRDTCCSKACSGFDCGTDGFSLKVGAENIAGDDKSTCCERRLGAQCLADSKIEGAWCKTRCFRIRGDAKCLDGNCHCIRGDECPKQSELRFPTHRPIVCKKRDGSEGSSGGQVNFTTFIDAYAGSSSLGI